MADDGDEYPSCDACEEAAYGALWGAFVADAAGAVLEFAPAEWDRSGARHAMTLPGGGKNNLRRGQVTDDSEMALALGLALAEQPLANRASCFPANAVALAYGRWKASNPPDIGNTVRASVGVAAPRGRQARPSPSIVPVTAALMAKTAARRSMASLGNGALMRAIPLAICFAFAPLAVIVDAAASDARLTHPNLICVAANVAYIAALATLIASASHCGVVDLAARQAAARESAEAALAELAAQSEGSDELDLRPPARWPRSVRLCACVPDSGGSGA
ncbi:ADP-ribosyl-[dinitrogen reductase] hydrolase [Thecamonas trahens ATCC 50062]|uniref:ADP-ribosyl-[dinitrogen reductase] hydrolase n=1 Tax=Thecamonas trahens ATCC 50062 TaxID=461836 RepID=A0A0L0DH89_THETB|nr:ADP-ribosyl-[dinitrogen reductase] hydrolase [Thecamonas trahens ATCC 50062]KNC50678.1 ADP-ribosyl-[dinitrogen reductase] hydrolase [Thecamonas trahens ATCC 50062]|eukprot:XP_013762558.1 ADP-ribosyl-[dinitrogen reductase] hydrolase [Thecamonas trahens ATCC 50062]